MAESIGPIVGIDLGTTNSVVAAIIDGKAQVLEEDGQQILPSIVGLDGAGKLITGVVARNQMAAFPDRVVASIKRKMGTMEPVPLGEQSFTPPEISAMILRRLRERASRALQQPVTRAVITVPAFFDEHQRQATVEAGELAGLKVERIINEPTAATLVYHAGSKDRQHVLVYDFGGGTFDVSIVRMEDGVVEVLSSKGDTQLGGDDLDRLLLDHVAKQFLAEHQIDLRENPSTRYRLLQACERAKVQLSTDISTQIAEEFIAEKDGQPLNLIVQLERDEFEELIQPLVDRTITSVDEAIRDAGLNTPQLDDLVLVGGSTRIPLVERRLREEFLREPSRAVDPDLAVAMGAAVQAAMIDGQTVGPVLVDVSGHTLGLEVAEGMSLTGPIMVFEPIIRRNSALPARFEDIYSKMFDEQDNVIIHVLQGEHPDVSRNRSIGEFRLKLASGGGELSKIAVRFDLSLNGTLNVTATQVATGASEQITIDNALSRFQAEEREQVEARLDQLFKDSDEIQHGDELSPSQQWLPPETPASDPQAADAEGDPERFHAEFGGFPSSDDGNLSPSADGKVDERFSVATALLERAAGLNESLSEEDAEEIEELSQGLRAALDAEDESAVRRLADELEDVLFYVQ